jgi:hypothetical protein
MVGWVSRASCRSFTTSDGELIPFSWLCIVGQKAQKMMASRTKALAIASWAFSSAIETFVNPMADATA